MPTLTTLLLFALAALGLLLIPGPSVVYGSPVTQMLILGVLFELVGVCTDSLYSLLGSTAGRWLTQNSYIQRGQRYITGSIYILLGLTTAVTGSEKR